MLTLDPMEICHAHGRKLFMANRTMCLRGTHPATVTTIVTAMRTSLTPMPMDLGIRANATFTHVVSTKALTVISALVG
jgi:hypothetical protein